MTSTILLVEDDTRIAEVAIAYLERAGFRVMHTFTVTGGEAMTLISYDLPPHNHGLLFRKPFN